MQMVEFKLFLWGKKNRGILKRATVFFNLPRSIVALQVKTHCYVFYRTFSGNLCLEAKEA